MKKLIFVLLLCLGTAHAKDSPYMAPTESFDATKLDADTKSITWLRVDDVEKGCADYASKVKLPTKIYKNIQACSFWTKSTCTIITSKKPNTDNVGHEIRHCYQGAWH